MLAECINSMNVAHNQWLKEQKNTAENIKISFNLPRHFVHSGSRNAFYQNIFEI